MRHALAFIILTGCGGHSPTAEPIAVPRIAASVAITHAPIERATFAPPFALTASDGTGLVLTRVAARAVVDGPLAFTELHLYFHNPEPRSREGTFQITLPERAAISRFAMENAGTWMEAEVVPKLAARRVYEDFLHRRQDPALLEKAAGNQFTARVFPIFAHADKHLVISYSQELPGTRYVLPLRGLPAAARVDVEVAVLRPDGTRTTEQLRERDWQPDRDFVASTPTTAAAIAAGSLVAAQVELVASTARDIPTGITLLVDTSASRALGYPAYVGAVKRLAGELRASYGDALPLQIVAFDQDTRRVFDGRAGNAGDLRTLVARGAAGASDLGQALDWLARHGAHQRVVVVTDGVITAGAEGAALQTLAKRLATTTRIDVVLAGGLRDEDTAALLARSGRRAGAVLDLDRDRVATALGESVATDLAIDVPGATWFYPRRIASARAGTRAIIYARLPAPATRFHVIANGARTTLHAAPATAPLVERALAGAELAELEARPAKTAAVRAQIAQKSVAARVLSSETAMLVLESEHDYVRYKIDRKALADVLVVGPAGVSRIRRADIAPIPTRPHSAHPVEEVAVRRATTEIDRDSDGIRDADDRCPDAPEIMNAAADDDGCPDRGRVVVSTTSIVVLEPVRFATNSARIDPRSFPLLDSLVETLRAHPDIELVEIQGHTDERGDARANLLLSEQRAEAVRDYLVAKGIDAKRLESRGYGEAMPLDGRHRADAWARDRRVDFLILRRSDSAPRVPGRVRPTKPTPAAPPPPPVTGELAAIQRAVAARDLDGALARARAWHGREPGNVLALIGLGEALEARRDEATAARIYGSIIDLFPGRADLRRFAGERLSRIARARSLVIDTFRRAVEDRPDHLTGHRLLAYALVRANRPADAFERILAALSPSASYRATSFAGGRELLREDAAMIGAVYANAVPAQRDTIVRALAKHQLVLATRPSTRFVLYWESDANDVDLHVVDARGEHASYRRPALPSGGRLLADVTTGYGPECFAIDGPPTAAPYQLAVEYYSPGPMGYGMGLVQVQHFDPRTGFRFDDRPFVITTPRARLELGAAR